MKNIYKYFSPRKLQQYYRRRKSRPTMEDTVVESSDIKWSYIDVGVFLYYSFMILIPVSIALVIAEKTGATSLVISWLIG